MEKYFISVGDNFGKWTVTEIKVKKKELNRNL